MNIYLKRDANDMHGPDDATAILPSLASVKPRMVYSSGTGLLRLTWKRPLNECCQCHAVVIVTGYTEPLIKVVKAIKIIVYTCRPTLQSVRSFTNLVQKAIQLATRLSCEL